MKRDMGTPLARQQAVIDTVSCRERRRFETQSHREHRGGKLESGSLIPFERKFGRGFTESLLSSPSLCKGRRNQLGKLGRPRFFVPRIR